MNEKLTLFTKVYKAVCQSMGEENINKLVRRYNHTLLCHCHTMTADKISLLFCHLRWTKNYNTYAGVVEGRHEWDDQVHVWAEVLQGCSWDQGQYFLHSLFLHKPLHFLITKNQGKFTGILPWQKAVGGKGQKGLWWDFVNNLQCTDGSHSWHCW